MSYPLLVRNSVKLTASSWAFAHETSGMIEARNSKPVVVVPVIGIVPVALNTTQIITIVVPGTPAQRTEASDNGFLPSGKK